MKQNQDGETNEAQAWTKISPQDRALHGYAASHQIGNAAI